MPLPRATAFVLAATLGACSDPGSSGSTPPADAGDERVHDSGVHDPGAHDSGLHDSDGERDVGAADLQAPVRDAEVLDALLVRDAGESPCWGVPEPGDDRVCRGKAVYQGSCQVELPPDLAPAATLTVELPFGIGGGTGATGVVPYTDGPCGEAGWQCVEPGVALLCGLPCGNWPLDVGRTFEAPVVCP